MRTRDEPAIAASSTVHISLRMRRVGFPNLAEPPLNGAFTHLSCVEEVVTAPGAFEQHLSAYTIQITTVGSALARVDGKEFHHRPGRMFIAGGGVELIEQSDQPWRLRYLILDGPWCAPLGDMLRRQGGGMIIDRPPRPWAEALHHAVETGITGNPGSAWRLASALATLLGGITGATPGQGDLLTEIGRLIDAAPERLWGVPALARCLKIPPRTLQARFRSLTGGGPAEWVLRRRLEHGRLLLQRGVAVHQVAASLGFPNQFHFSRVCKRLWGVAPSALRRVP